MNEAMFTTAKAVRGFLYTLLGVVAVGMIALAAYLALGWLNII